MHTYNSNYENKLKEIEADIENGTHFFPEYIQVLPEYIIQKYLSKCAEKPDYRVNLWIYNQFTTEQKNTFHKSIINHTGDIDEEVIKILPEKIRDEWINNHLSTIGYLPDYITDFIDKEKHAEAIAKLYKNLTFRDTRIFNFLSPELKLDLILREGSKLIGDDAVKWLKSFKKGKTREEIIKSIIED